MRGRRASRSTILSARSHVIEACGVRPRRRSARVGLARVASRDFAVQRQPEVDRGLVGVPAAAHSHRRAPRPPLRTCTRASSRAGRERIGKVLEHLVRVHHVERVVVHLEGIEVADRELDIRTGVGVTSRLLDHGGRRIDAGTRPGATRRPMSAVIVPGPHPRSSTLVPSEVRAEISGRVVDRAPLVRPQYALVVTVRVGHRVSSSRQWR